MLKKTYKNILKTTHIPGLVKVYITIWKITIVLWVNQVFLWPCSIAMFVYQRVITKPKSRLVKRNCEWISR